MIVGFNHNFRYQGETFHVQTEDGGRNNPRIITLLYQAGTILASKKTCYADILKVDNLEAVVEDLMKEQHKEMLRRLKAGEFDAVIGGQRSRPVAGEPPAAVPPAPPVTPSAAPPSARPVPFPIPAVTPPRRPPEETSLDEAIFSYLAGDGDET